MNRPRGLLLTAWIMVALNITAWILQYRPHLAHRVPLHTFTVVLFTLALVVIRIGAFVCIVYYVRGRNWARIAVLLTSVLSILYLLRLNHEDAPGRVVSAAWGLLGVFFLYWLNTRSVREFFKRGGATIEQS